MPLTVLEGSTFCVCDERGDVDGSALASGFFASDTRFLSRSVLTVGGARPEPLSHAQATPHLASFVLRNPLAAGLGPNELSIERERFVGDAMEERIALENHARRPVEVELGLKLEVDFADIFAVKSRDPSLGDPLHPLGVPDPRPARWDDRSEALLFEDEGYPARTLVHLSRPPELQGGVLRYRVALEPGERWDVTVTVQPLLNGDEPLKHEAVGRRLADDRHRAEESLHAWRRSVPRLRASWDDLERTWNRSVADIAALRIRSRDGLDFGHLPAAGTPWFMTVFGRDTLITCLQTLVFGPELATSALRTLAATQATEDDADRDAEPGKVLHELRSGKAAALWTDRYYGAADATPLFLILLSELWRWTDDADLVRELEQPARRALGWIDGPGDRDRDGFVEYERRARRGSYHQSWKDSDDSMAFRDGTPALPPIAPVEVQGYVYDAKLRAAELAREVWRDRATAERLERDAAELRRRFDEAFWVAEGGFYALGLDREKRPIDALGSNMGHLLWSGIVPPERADAVADALMGDALWSGWGVRTMAASEAAYNPLVYHNGTVWPHDNSLIAWGLARAGRHADAQRILRRMVEAASHFDYRLPEVFAGFARGRTPMPVAYPTASVPQAWAAGTPVLLLRVLLGLEPDRAAGVLRVGADELPSWLGSLTLEGIRAYGKRWTVRVEDGRAAVSSDMLGA